MPIPPQLQAALKRRMGQGSGPPGAGGALPGAPSKGNNGPKSSKGSEANGLGPPKVLSLQPPGLTQKPPENNGSPKSGLGLPGLGRSTTPGGPPSHGFGPPKAGPPMGGVGGMSPPPPKDGSITSTDKPPSGGGVGGFGALARRLGGQPPPGNILGSGLTSPKTRLSPNNTKGAGAMIKPPAKKGKGPATKGLSNLPTPKSPF